MTQAARNKNRFDEVGELEYLQSEFQRRTGLNETIAGIAVDHYLKFLSLKKRQYTTFVPSEMIDAVWHIHLENPAAYKRFCQNHVGKPVSHTPGGTPDQLAAGWENTVKSFMQDYHLNLEEARFGYADSNGIACRSNVAGDCI